MIKKIMIVDDTAFMRNTIKRMCTEVPACEVVCEAKDGEEAIMLYRMEKPDIVILDLGLPKMDGLTVLDEIRKIDKNAQVIICSGHTDTTEIKKSISEGAVDYLLKPINYNRFFDAVNKVKIG